MHYAYIIKSDKSDKWYYGSTSDLKHRFFEHNNRKVVSTKSGVPWKLIYTEKFKTKTEAQLREKYFKNTRNKAYLTKVLNIGV
jgi:putative endonuclease